MANDIFQLWQGPFVYNLQTLQGVLVDVVPGGTKGLCREKPGVAEVLAEIGKGVPIHAATLGVAADTHTRLNTLTEQIAQVRAARADLAKAVEVLEETQVCLEDERENQIGTVVEAVRKAARRKDPSVVAAFETTIRYHGQIAARANQTRRKNAEEAARAEAKAAKDTQPDPR